MRYFWINKKSNKDFILFMNGWGMDENVIKHLNSEDFDILVLYDYRTFDIDISEFDIDKYKNKYLVAWSMGVYISNLFKDYFSGFNKKIAIAGTNKIIDNGFGIPLKIYNYTIKFFSEKSAQKFIENIFQKNVLDFKINRTTEELKDELISIQNLEIENEIQYDKAIIPKEDSIVPYKNQINYWRKTQAEIIELNSPHYVFDNFKNWREIIC